MMMMIMRKTDQNPGSSLNVLSRVLMQSAVVCCSSNNQNENELTCFNKNILNSNYFLKKKYIILLDLAQFVIMVSIIYVIVKVLS